jgi:hypothetical protein
VCQLDDVDQAYVSLSAFDSANIIAVQVGQFCQLFLRQSSLKSELAYSSTEHNARVDWHAAMIVT